MVSVRTLFEGGWIEEEEPRIVPINNTLLPILNAWIAKRDNREGLLFPPRGHGLSYGLIPSGEPWRPPWRSPGFGP